MRRTLLTALAAALLLAAAAPALAQSPNVRTAKEALEAAKKAYNDEKYPEAAQLYIRAAQLDPGARTLKGEPYLNLARSLFWQERFDQAAFWYQTYLREFPKNADHAQVTEELRAVNARRANPDQPLTDAAVYPQPVLDMIATLKQRLKDEAPAFTAQGGGTAALYNLAMERGYALPDLAPLAEALRDDLNAELERRLKRPDDAPLPPLGDDAEPLDISVERLRTLRTLPLSKPQLQRVADLQLLTDALRALDAAQPRGAIDALDALAQRPEAAPDYLPYARALAFYQDQRPDDALEALHTALPKATPALRPWLELLRAELLRAKNDDAQAARALLAVLAPTDAAPLKLAPPTPADTGNPPSDEVEPQPPPVKTLQGSDGDKTIKLKPETPPKSRKTKKD